ncbi:MAG: SAM-dependent methyltransferase [Armatimonadetes bacterium]|nr:SAM-dependent methyltransferase [Armatimonadota bacterium]
MLTRPGRPCYALDMQIDANDPRTWPKSALEFLHRRERATLGSAPLVAQIRERIERGGPIPFAEFMRLALYHREHGYYASPDLKMGREGDFLTSPETHPAFGALVCRRLQRIWEALGAPGRFEVVEGGPGSGALAEQILDYAGARFPALADAIRCTLVEASAALRGRQAERLARHGDRVRWVESLAAIPPASVTGCVLSNELLDALPVHRVRMTPDGLREIHVGLRDGEFTDVPLPLSTPEIAAFFEGVGVWPPPGADAEAGLAAAAWYRAAAERLARGALLTIDYGHPAGALYTSARRRGTLLCYYRHTANEEPYRRVGTQDITAHVDFTAVRAAGEAAGLTTRAVTTQDEWLRSLGIDDWLSGRERWPDGQPRRPDDLLALIRPSGLGRLRVLIQTTH